MTINVIIIILFAAMVVVLFQGLYHMLKTSRDDIENRGKVARSLTWRIGIWVVLFFFIIAAKEIGWLKPSESINPMKLQQEAERRQQTEK